MSLTSQTEVVQSKAFKIWQQSYNLTKAFQSRSTIFFSPESSKTSVSLDVWLPAADADANVP